MMYADDNSDKIMNGDAEEYGDWETSTGAYASNGNHYKEKPWVLQDSGSPPLPINERKTKDYGWGVIQVCQRCKGIK